MEHWLLFTWMSGIAVPACRLRAGARDAGVWPHSGACQVGGCMLLLQLLLDAAGC